MHQRADNSSKWQCANFSQTEEKVHFRRAISSKSRLRDNTFYPAVKIDYYTISKHICGFGF
jgi:hypothetical protein